MSDTLQRVTIVSPDPVTPEGHDEKMIALVDAKAAEQSGRPEWLPAKFATAEEMAASYKELEAKQGAPKAPEAAPVVPLTVTAPVAPVAPEAAAAVAQAGLDMAALNAEFAADGKLSDANMAKLAAAGFDKATVDSYVAGQQAIAAQFSSEVQGVTPGGAEKYGEMVSWAAANLSAPEIDAFNAAVTSGSKDQAKLAVAGLGTKFSAAVGNEPNLHGGRAGGAADVFESLAQMKVAMGDKRYRDDPAYRNSVREKLGRSDIF